MAIQKISNAVIDTGAVTSDSLATGAVNAADISAGTITVDKLHTTLNLSSHTVTLPSGTTLGTTTAGLFDIQGGSTTSAQIRFFDGGTAQARIGVPAGETYLSLSGSNTLTPDVVVTSGGNVGIGTSSPSAPLNIEFSNNDGGVGGLLIKNSNTGTTSNFSSLSTQAVNGTIQGTFGSAYYPSWGGSVVFAGAQTGHPFTIITSNAVRATVTASGNVGINETSPAGKLEVQNTSVNYAILGTSNNGHYFESQSDDNTDGFEIYQQHGSTTTRNSFIVNDNRTGSKSAAFLVRGDGNVGIGTTSPTKTLHVDGQSLITDTAYFGNTNLARWGETTGSGGVNIKPGTGSHVSIASNHSDGYANLYLNRIDVTSDITSNNNRFIDFYYDGVSGVRVRGNSNKDLSFDMHGGGNFLLPSGNVGIGTASPSTTLHVQKSVSGDFISTFQNTNSSTPYGVWVKDAATPANGYPLLQVTDSAGTGTYFRVDSGTGYVTTPYQPSFFAYGSGSWAYVPGSDTKTSLNSTRHNIGGAWNVATNTFTAPIEGLYTFSIVTTLKGTSGSGGDYNAFYLRHNGSAVPGRARATPPSTNQWASWTGTWTIRLAVNDTIEGFFYAQTGNQLQYTAHEMGFSGYLVG